MADIDGNAPYATTAIPLWLNSLTGHRYRTLQCIECGQPFLERNNDTLWRLNDTSSPSEIAINGENQAATCGSCHQTYSVHVSLDVSLARDGVALYLQPESLYIAVALTKKLRYIHCLECGKPFHSISDRVSQIVDNRIPFEFVNPSKLGPIETFCHGRDCRQTWALMV